jgi:HEPN domain-containing protein
MSDVTDPLAWVARAKEDYSLARSALRRKRPLTSGACFHAQQCVEKYLKAALVARGQTFPKTHDLSALNSLAAQAGIVVPIEPAELGPLSDAAVLARYPGDQPTLDEAREALEVAKAGRRFVRRLLGLK